MHCRQSWRDLGKRSEQTHWVEMSERIEAPGELLLGLDVRRAGDPVSLYAPIFAVSRTSGWTAHVLEQYANNRLMPLEQR